MKNNILLKVLFTAFIAFPNLSCKQEVTQYISPRGYDFNHPVRYKVPDELLEISGIAFNKGDSKLLYAEEDENGMVYYMKWGDRKVKYSKFKETGDFEDMTICNGQVVMLQSKGKLYTFPLDEVGKKKKIDDVKKFEDMLPDGEFEGMYGDDETSKIYVMCKHCEIDKTSKQTSGFVFQMDSNGKLVVTDQFKINVKHIADQLNAEKFNFHPSALARSPYSKMWFVLSSVNKLLVILDDKWRVKQVFKLNPAIFPQPEGMTFDNKNNLYISNEGDKLDPANVLKFTYKAPK